ncbi:hypothetical protein FQA39_LY04935 [Lamprigera yunnana]|nr:hypothetical protein FQA39_LY04935 [Lamprigera yunnana]
MPRTTLGPGPGAYMLPTTVGYKDHHYCKYRNPMFSMPQKLCPAQQMMIPGPQYDISKVTQHGQITAIQYTIPIKTKIAAAFPTPGPDVYYTEKVPRLKEARPPVYTIPRSSPCPNGFITPSPNQYLIPTTIGPKIPFKLACPAYTIPGKSYPKGTCVSPGPADYAATSPDMYKLKAPNYTMKLLNKGKSPQKSPGPAAYFPKIRKPVPGGLTMGLLYDKAPYITADDHYPCLY